MSAARVRIFEAEVQMVPLRDIEVLPEQLQSRAGTDPEIVRVYSERRRGKPGQPGSPFPPVLIYIVDGRWLLADGFHRCGAAEKLGEETIPAIVRRGTMTDAILAGGEINMSKENLRGYQEADRRRFAELLIRNGAGKPGEGSWDWSDAELALRSGCSQPTIHSRRAALRAAGVPIPEKVKAFGGGIWTGRWRRYRTSRTTGKLAIHKTRTGAPRVCFDGRDISLSRNPDIAAEQIESIMEGRKSQRATLVRYKDFKRWLELRGVVTEAARSMDGPPGLKVGESRLLLVADPTNELIRRAIGDALLHAKRSDAPTRLIVVGYFGGCHVTTSQLINLARKPPIPIEFMTPEEVVAEFGPKPEDGESQDADESVGPNSAIQS
jgi:hypothetical protein